MSQFQIVSTDLLIEFLEIAFNAILYSRKLYPDELFTKRKIYSSIAYVSQHPEINEYLGNVLKAIRELIVMDRDDDKSIASINLLFVDKDRQVVEKYVFNVLNLRGNDLETDPYFLKIEELFRRLLLKLSMATSYLKTLPEDSSFFINVETPEWAHVALCENSASQSFPWIVDERDSTRDHNLLHPLTVVKTQNIEIEMFVIENSI